MSLLSQIYATPSRVEGVLQLLVHEPGQRLKRQTAEELLSPSSLAQPDDGETAKRLMIHYVVDECIRMHLLVDDDGHLALSPELPDSLRQAARTVTILPEVVLNLVLDSENAANRDLAAALAWFLGQDVLSPPATWDQFSKALETQGVPERLKFNDTRFGMFMDWSRYLGLANILAVPTGRGVEERLEPDPTVRLRRVLSEVLGQRRRPLPVAECLQGMRARCALFEGGELREDMDRFAPRREAKHLSSSTSHALLRLEEEGTIVLGALSDADAVVLVDASERRPVSEVAWAHAVREPLP